MINIKLTVHQAADRNICTYHTLLDDPIDDPVPHKKKKKKITLKYTYCFKICIYIFGSVHFWGDKGHLIEDGLHK